MLVAQDTDLQVTRCASNSVNAKLALLDNHNQSLQRQVDEACVGALTGELPYSNT